MEAAKDGTGNQGRGEKQSGKPSNGACGLGKGSSGADQARVFNGADQARVPTRPGKGSNGVCGSGKGSNAACGSGKGSASTFDAGEVELSFRTRLSVQLHAANKSFKATDGKVNGLFLIANICLLFWTQV